MNFYIDFEATQFSQRIISIGCVAENGATFDTYVDPGDVKDRVTKFITELTGITEEMLMNAPSADEAFSWLFDFICRNSKDEAPKYYCYGDCDKGFLSHTVKHMSNPKAIMCATTIKSLLIDYQIEVKTFFKSKESIGLKKVYNFIQDENGTQRHDALEDALMLQLVKNKMKEKCTPQNKSDLDAMPSSKKKSKNLAPAIYLSWNGYKVWQSITDGTADDWQYKCTDCSTGKVKYFKSLDTAALWLIRYFVRKKSPKNIEHINECKEIILGSMSTNKKHYGLTWEENN